MRRVLLFWNGLPTTSKLQFFALGLVLGYAFVANDLNPANRFFGRSLWQFTVPIIFGAFVLARLLLPVMMRFPVRAQQVLNGFGLVVFGVWMFSANQWWGRLILTYFGIIGGMWLDASCWFWFVSEMKQREAILLEQLRQFNDLVQTENGGSMLAIHEDDYEDDEEENA
jgi:hypothetical protein